MTDKVTVWPTFFNHSIEVDPDEAAALERGGMLRAGPLDAEPAEQDVEVVPVFTGLPMRMPVAEAEALDHAGLLIHDPAPDTEQPQTELHDQTAGQQEPDSEQENQ